ncbi:transmembrane protein 144-like [Plakobranchus ocellatus]|uniref:Transmembrane protein 144-like n=1 Tax=Plakobranchus ocellatus TaxID=259542 RepID=A0AAV4B6B4_9GAST|nr:transmembrane protein 144-like [Plakobranchus ocellatus]
MAAGGDLFGVLESFGENVTTTMPPTTTDTPKPYPVFVGYICAIIAVVLYGSNFVPVKKFYTGDGMFFQFILCNGIFLVGIVVQLIQGSKFFPLVMVGGAIWATGNLCVVPIIKTIGMGLGLSLWGTIALLSGWASGKFGWFHTNKDEISHVGLNYGGVVLAGCSILLYLLVKDEVSSGKPKDEEVEVVISSESDPLIPTGNYNTDTESNEEDEILIPSSVNASQRNTTAALSHFSDSQEVLVFGKMPIQDDEEREEVEGPHSALHDDRLFFEDFPPTTKKLIGLVLCLFSGTCYGLNFAPSIYVQDNWGYKGATKNGLDYVFAQFVGIYLASSIYFYIYCVIKKNSPKIYPKVILPGVISGILWAIATACWFVANAELSVSVSFPIVSTGPSAIASLFWGVCVFGEIRGVRNILILVAGFLVMTAGALLAGFSR